MTGFPLPATPAVNLPAFRDAESASLWLARQPQANLPAMLSGLLDQLEAFNRHDLSPRERFKTLEVLRKAVFAVGDGCRRRCEGKPLPLAAAEQATLDSARRLWRNYAAGYQRCLQACLDGDSSLSRRSARVAHRMAFCLRMEQLTGYAGSAAPGPGFWKSFHALFLATERLGCAGEAVEDRLLGETRASSVSGQYAMALMLHLAQPFSLSGGQLAAAVRWLARWRERVRIAARPDAEAKFPPLLLDLSADAPLRHGEGEAHLPRWLVLDAVLGKIRERCAALAAGESPESLKLGDRLSAESCMALLETLAGRLPRPPQVFPADTGGMPELSVGAGLTVIHRLLGGEGLEEALHPASSADHRLTSEQLAVFGHVVREAPPSAETGLERWRLAYRERNELVLLRLPGSGTSRLALRGLLAIRRQEGCLLAVITGLRQCEDGILCCTVSPLSGDAAPRGVEVRDRITGKVARHPAFLLAAGKDRRQDLLLTPAGVMGRASGVRFLDGGGQPLPELRLAECLERGGEVDFWRVAAGD